MNKIFSIAFIAMLFVNFSNAQDGTGNLEFAAGAGYNWSGLTGESGNAETKGGFNFHVSTEYQVNEFFGIKLKLSKSNKGFKQLNENVMYFSGNSEKIDLSYFTIPLVINYHLNDVYGSIGAYQGFLVSAEDNNGIDFKDKFKNTDFGVVGAIGYKFFVGDNLNWYMETQYEHGLSNISNMTDSSLEPISFKTTCFSVNIGLVFVLEKE